MRLLPDKHFKENYKKRYAENYDKIMAFRKSKAEEKAARPVVSPEIRKQRLVGAIAVIAIFGCIFCTGRFVLTRYFEKEYEIDALEQKAAELDELTLRYQVINSDEKYEQINEALERVVDLQNQYVTLTFSEDFEAYSNRYLGNYNSSWAGTDMFYAPVWKGYIDSSCDFRDTADMIFVLYDADKPVIVVNASFELNLSGNLGEMTRFDKMRLI